MKNVKSGKRVEPKAQGSTVTNFLRGAAKKEAKFDESLFYDLTKFWSIIQD